MRVINFLIENKELILILSGIGTFVSSLIAIFTLREVIKQRLSLYKPDILLKTFLVAISKSPLQKEPEELLNYKVCNFNDYSNNYNNIEFENSAKYKVENLGLGVAKNIKCKWKFDTKKAIKEIEKIMTPNYSFSHHKNLNLYFLVDHRNEEFHYSSFANIDKQSIDYVSPINIQQHYHYHTIPEIIIFTHYLFLLFKNNLVEKTGEDFHTFSFEDYKFPEPILQIEYRDLNNKKHSNKYKFKVQAVQTQSQDILDLTKEFSYLEFELD